MSSHPDHDISFSVIIPAHNEEASIGGTLTALVGAFSENSITDYEIIVVDDNSTDGTAALVHNFTQTAPRVQLVNNTPPHGYGFALRKGLSHYRGEAACVVMADLSDNPSDVITCYRAIRSGAECVFGSRFIEGSQVIDYPRFKLLINRMANWFIRLLFGIRYNDTTNAFKCYRREVIDGIQPLISPHFNLTVEMPLKAIVRGYDYRIIPISWTGRKKGSSKLQLREMGSRYLFIVLYVLMEKLLTRGDYCRSQSHYHKT